jgi:hypothetical protein
MEETRGGGGIKVKKKISLKTYIILQCFRLVRTSKEW